MMMEKFQQFFKFIVREKKGRNYVYNFDNDWTASDYLEYIELDYMGGRELHFQGYLWYETEEAIMKHLKKNESIQDIIDKFVGYVRGVQGYSNFTYNRKYESKRGGEKFKPAMNIYFENNQLIPKNYLYEFWIRTGIRWLFEKRKSSLNWEDAIMKFNGSVDKALKYKNSVLSFYENAKSNYNKGVNYNIRQ